MSTSLNLLFFVLKQEPKKPYDPKVGYIRIADVNRKRIIESVEVTQTEKTFEALKKTLLSLAEPLDNSPIPNSTQCFAIRWTPEVSSAIAKSDCLLCKEVADNIYQYSLHLESARLRAVG